MGRTSPLQTIWTVCLSLPLFAAGLLSATDTKVKRGTESSVEQSHEGKELRIRVEESWGTVNRLRREGAGVPEGQEIDGGRRQYKPTPDQEFL
ncbi:hypothetical protein R1flu_023692 [Riccia fluitans]|uniref:Uncharacterized protein n=1 Tax=Riccia fluitans TaxID=41844 RepID=A0ABD1XSR9_9MARC